MRDIRNYIFGLGTADVEGTDLNAALQQVLREFEVNSLAAARLDMDPNLPELSVQARAHLLQFVREALSNVLKHASAGQVRVSILREGAEMVASVSDDGKGFDPDQAGPSKGYGLRNMAERAKAFGGSFHLSSNPGLGTTVTLRLPLDSVTGLR